MLIGILGGSGVNTLLRPGTGALCQKNVFCTVFLVVCINLTLLFTSAAQDLPIGSFGSTNYGDWKATGTAFRLGPASGDLLPQLEIENALDNRVISSEIEGDGPTGTLTSPEFKISRNYISFRIGGGDYERDTCLNLLINGKIVRSATGWNSDRLVPASWSVTQYMGQNAQIQVVDRASGGWGHINVDQIVQTDNPERFPVVTEPLYQENLRPQFHFTARQWTMDRLNPGMQQEGWVNDLNGLIYYEGEYHLFAQRWAKCWIHAVSRDLVHWTELEPAFWEETAGSGCQSGTSVIDYNNVSGLSPNTNTPPMIAFFPRWDNRSQCIAYSLDHGRSWKFYGKNPVLVAPERDPKVFWYAPSNHWVMMLYGNGQYNIFTSTNLLNWKDEQHPIQNSFECPDFFELPVDGNRNNTKWVLIQGNGNYSIGSFDGTEFKEETGRRPCDIGPNFYATQTWGNVETGDGRRIQTAWMQGSSFPDMPFNQQIAFPCELTLRTTAGGLQVFRQPISEIALLHNGQDVWTNRTLQMNEELPLEPSGRSFHIKAQVSIPAGAKLTFNLRGVPVVLTSKTIEPVTSPASVQDQVKSVEILVDRASIEAFVNQGEISSTRFVLPTENGLSVKAEVGAVILQSLVIYPLNSAWSDATSVVFTAEPKSQIAYMNDTNNHSVTLTVETVGAPATYQWYQNGNAVSGATNADLTLSTQEMGNAGDYYVVATSASGSITSATAPFTVYGKNNRLFTYEGFDYTGSYGGNTPIDDGNHVGGFGWNGPWLFVDGSQGNSQVRPASLAGGAKVPNGYDSRSIGNSLWNSGNSRVGRIFDTSGSSELFKQGFVDANGNVGANGKTIYLSFLQQPNTTGIYYELGVKRGNLGDAGRIAGIGNDRGGTSNHANFRTPDTSWDLGAGDANVANLYVMRIDYKDGNDDVFIYRNPTSITEPSTPTLTVSNLTDMSFYGISVDAFVGAAAMNVDEIRLGATWEDAIGLAVSNLLPPTRTANGCKVRFACTPGYSYRIERATTITGPWTEVSTVVGSQNGFVEYEDVNTPSGQAFYRTVVR